MTDMAELKKRKEALNLAIVYVDPDAFIANFMTNFSDDAHAAELKSFAPAQATPAGRVNTARALETMAIAADLKARALPAVDAWIGAQK